MGTLKIFYADDHIPSQEFYSVHEDELRNNLRKRYARWDQKNIEDWTKVYFNASSVIQKLAAAYELTKTNSYQEALDLAGSSHFDIAIIDIGWFNDSTLPKHVEADNAGWDICEKITETNEKLKSKPTLQIAYSSRFVERSGLSNAAIQRGVLPFFKARNDASAAEIEANVSALNAVVNFLVTTLSSRSPIEEILQKTFEDLHKTKLEAFKEDQKETQSRLKNWSIWALRCGIASVILVAVGILGAYFWNVQVGTVTAISSAIPTLFSGIFYVMIEITQKRIADSLSKLDKQSEKAINTLIALSMENTQDENFS